MRFDQSYLMPLHILFARFSLNEEGRLCCDYEKGGPVGNHPRFQHNGVLYHTRYAAYARLWGHHPEFSLRAHPDIEDPEENRASDWVEVPKDGEAPTTGPNPEYFMPSPRTGKTRVRIVPKRLENAPVSYRYVRQKQFDPGQDTIFDGTAQEWQEAVLQNLKLLAGDARSKWNATRRSGQKTTEPQLRRPTKVLDQFLVDRPSKPQHPLLHPLEQWHLQVDDGGDPAGVNATPPSPLKPQQPQQQTVQVPTIDPGKLPLPLTQPVAQMDMTSYKAVERLLGIAARLSGRAQNQPVHLTLTLGPLDGCWRTFATTTDPTSCLPLQDVRESQPGALRAAQDKGWDFQISRTVKARLTKEEVKAFRGEILKRWQATPPPPGAIRAAQAAWTATPTPRLGGDLRRAPEASQMPSTVLQPGQDESAPSFNLELVLENLAAPGGDPLNFALWAPPNRGGAQSGLSLRVTRTTHSFEFTLVGRPKSDPEGQYRTVNTFRLPSRIAAKKLNAMPKRRIFVSNAANRAKLLALAPQIVKEIKARLKEEREFYQPTNRGNLNENP